MATLCTLIVFGLPNPVEFSRGDSETLGFPHPNGWLTHYKQMVYVSTRISTGVLRRPCIGTSSAVSTVS
jgi:hypothetical protein